MSFNAQDNENKGGEVDETSQMVAGANQEGMYVSKVYCYGG